MSSENQGGGIWFLIGIILSFIMIIVLFRPLMSLMGQLFDGIIWWLKAIVIIGIGFIVVIGISSLFSSKK